MVDESKEKAGGAGGEESPEEQDYVRMIMNRHKPVTEWGVGAIARVVAIAIVIGIVVLAAVWIALVQVGDSYTSATLGEVMRQSKRPLVQQNAVQKLFMPNFVHLKSLAVPQVLYTGHSDMVLPGGYRIHLDGVTNLKDLFKRARKMQSAPVFKMSAHDGRVHVDKMMILDEVLLVDFEMKFVGRLDLLKRMPERSSKGEPGTIRRAPEFAYDDDTTFKKFVGQVIAIAGKPLREGDRWVLDAGKWKMVLLLAPGERGLNTILDLALKNDEPMMIDILFKEAYDWKNRKHPEKSRSETQIVGEAELLSASLQGLHIGLAPVEVTEG
ncbi:MAG: hypothetical protein KAW17_01915 [Candidatus Eisenbacteria sp.]|nr:hypothetical protein [Candidatus Eisenbacteria bacterium]